MNGREPADLVDRAALSRTLVALADTLVHDFDVVAFLQLLSSRCVDLFGAASAGIMLRDPYDVLQVVASSDERARALELMELQTDEGPSLEVLRLTTPVQVRSSDVAERWPTFASHAAELGYQAMSAVPMRLRQQTIGVLNLFHADDELLGPLALQDAQAIADVATIGILSERAVRESRQVAEQLQHALTSRVCLEQAKGVLAVKLDCDVDAAFEFMRRYARNRNLPLTGVARAVVGGVLDASAVREG